MPHRTRPPTPPLVQPARPASPAPPAARRNPWEPIPPYAEPSAHQLQVLSDLWLMLDRELPRFGGRCRACGECCDFPRQGHVLFAAKPELDACLAWARENFRATPEGISRSLAEGRCPFWQGRRCAVHPVRPLGCRLFLCNPRSPTDLSRLSQRFHALLAERLAGPDAPWWYGPALAYMKTNARAFIHDAGRYG